MSPPQTQLPSRRVAHLIEAGDLRDVARVDRILAKAARDGAGLASEVAATFEAAERMSPEDAVRTRAAAGALGAATMVPEGCVFHLVERAHAEPAYDTSELAKLLELDQDLWTRTARYAIEYARERRDDALIALAAELLGLANSDDTDALAALVRLADDHPLPAVRGLIQHRHDDSTEFLLAWMRGLPDPAGLSDEHCRVLFEVLVELWGREVRLTQSDLERAETAGNVALEAMRRETDHLTAMVEKQGRALQSPRRRTLVRRRTGPNAPCDCGSGRKTKKCCG